MLLKDCTEKYDKAHLHYLGICTVPLLYEDIALATPAMACRSTLNVTKKNNLYIT